MNGQGLVLLVVGAALAGVGGVLASRLFPSWDGSNLTWTTLILLLVGMASLKFGILLILLLLLLLTIPPGGTLLLLGLLGLAASCSSSPGLPFTYGFLLLILLILQVLPFLHTHSLLLIHIRLINFIIINLQVLAIALFFLFR